MSTPTPEAESLKDRGNELFARGKYGAAIDAYTNALDLCPRWIVPLVNRALMYRHKRDWANVRADCERALSIDREHMKANYYLGLAMIGEGDHPDAARRLNKALESARTQGASIQTEIWRMYALAKYYEWAAAASKRKARYDAIEAKLAAACGVEVPSKTGGTKNGGSGAFDDPMDLTMDENAFASSSGAFASSSDTAVNATRMNGTAGASSTGPTGPTGLGVGDWDTVREMLDAVRRCDDRSDEPPDCFCCKVSLFLDIFIFVWAILLTSSRVFSQLTFEVFRDPVVAPSGHSYERVAVMEHLRRVGKFDPVTREPLVESDLRPNHSLRNAAHEWLNDHAWAFADIINPNQELAEFTAP